MIVKLVIAGVSAVLGGAMLLLVGFSIGLAAGLTGLVVFGPGLPAMEVIAMVCMLAGCVAGATWGWRHAEGRAGSSSLKLLRYACDVSISLAVAIGGTVIAANLLYGTTRILAPTLSVEPGLYVIVNPILFVVFAGVGWRLVPRISPPIGRYLAVRAPRLLTRLLARSL